MKKILDLIILLIIAGFPVTGLFAQQEILSSGGNAESSGGSISWSVGLVAYSLWSDTTGVVSEGVQQPYEVTTIGIHEALQAVKCSVFPNPTDKNLTVKYSGKDFQNMSYRLFSMNGSVVREGMISSGEVVIRMEETPAASYFLAIIENEQPIAIYKIIKK